MITSTMKDAARLAAIAAGTLGLLAGPSLAASPQVRVNANHANTRPPAHSATQVAKVKAGQTRVLAGRYESGQNRGVVAGAKTPLLYPTASATVPAKTLPAKPR